MITAKKKKKINGCLRRRPRKKQGVQGAGWDRFGKSKNQPPDNLAHGQILRWMMGEAYLT